MPKKKTRFKQEFLTPISLEKELRTIVSEELDHIGSELHKDALHKAAESLMAALKIPPSLKVIQ